MSAADAGKDELLDTLAALVEGDRYLNANACAVYLGRIARRTFLERVACRPDFPSPYRILGAMSVWKRSEIDEWVSKQRRANQAA